MTPLTEAQIRKSFINTTRKEVSDLTLPAQFSQLDWDRLDFLGWTDPKLPRRSYVVAEIDGGGVGMLLRQAETPLGARAQCSWCDDITLMHDVQFFGAKKAGAAGRRGDTIGTLVCADFACSENVRKPPRLAYQGFDIEAAREERIRRLGEHVRGFIRALGATT